MGLLNNETIHIISMIVCIIAAIVFIFSESENLVSKSFTSSLFGAMTLILIAFVPMINIMIAIVLVLFFVITLLAYIFEKIKR